MEPILSGQATIIQVDSDPTHLGKRHPVAIGAVKATLEALLPRLQQHEENQFLTAHVERHRKDVEKAKAETVSGRDAMISGTYLTQIINKHAADDALFAADDGTPLVWMLRHIETNGKRRTFGSLLHGTMATACPPRSGSRNASRADRCSVSQAMAGFPCCWVTF